MTLERWFALMKAWGFAQNEATFFDLTAAYSEKGRYYHTAEHVSACLQHLARFSARLDAPRELETALWFHDAVYEPFSSNNEQASADWAASFLTENGASHEVLASVHRLILLTKHDAPTFTRDEAAMLDIDLSILGADPATYDAFEKAVRKEYALVPTFIFRRKRAEVLRGFLARSRIYTSGLFGEGLEVQARGNLSKSLANLEDRA